VTDDLSLAPFRIHTLDDGSQQLWLFDGDMEEVADVFDDRDAESNGTEGKASPAGCSKPKCPTTPS
jgi:hypothetical protein